MGGFPTHTHMALTVIQPTNLPTYLPDVVDGYPVSSVHQHKTSTLGWNSAYELLSILTSVDARVYTTPYVFLQHGGPHTNSTRNTVTVVTEHCHIFNTDAFIRMMDIIKSYFTRVRISIPVHADGLLSGRNRTYLGTEDRIVVGTSIYIYSAMNNLLTQCHEMTFTRNFVLSARNINISYFRRVFHNFRV